MSKKKELQGMLVAKQKAYEESCKVVDFLITNFNFKIEDNKISCDAQCVDLADNQQVKEHLEELLKIKSNEEERAKKAQDLLDALDRFFTSKEGW